VFEIHGEEELRPLVLFRFELNLAAHALDDVLRDDQPEPGALLFRRLVVRGLRERHEQIMLLRRGDPDAVVLDAKRDARDVANVVKNRLVSLLALLIALTAR